ncbi:MAG: hypothetical protein KGJ77_06075 [Acidobacteriota bacterium]|nr:hypothetical protein [Acidobacteriota bacterium]
MTLSASPRDDHGPDAGTDSRYVLARSGAVVGRVVASYRSSRAAWIAVDVGLLQRRVVMAPLEGSRVMGSDLVLPWDAAVIREAPAASDLYCFGVDEMSEYRLRRHYCL